MIDTTARFRVADRMVGIIDSSGANNAIAQLRPWLCTKSSSDSIRLSASRAILTHWLKVSQHFYVKVKIKALEEFLERIDNKVKARRRADNIPTRGRHPLVSRPSFAAGLTTRRSPRVSGHPRGRRRKARLEGLISEAPR